MVDKKKVIKITAGIILLGFLLSNIGIGAIALKITTIPLELLLLAFFLTFGVIIVNGAAVFFLYKEVSDIPLGKFMSAFFASWVLSYITPGKIGGIGIALILKDKVKPGKSTAIFITDKIITLAITFIAAFLMLPVFLSETEFIFLSIAFIAGLIGFILLAGTESGRNLLKKILGKRSNFFEGYAKTFPELLKKPKGILLNILMTLIRLFIQGIILFIIFTGINVNVDILQMTLLVSVSTILSFVPFTFSGLGVKENVFVALASKMGLPPIESAAVAIVSTSISWITMFILSGILWKEVNRIVDKLHLN